jgi:hypothetical protein
MELCFLFVSLINLFHFPIGIQIYIQKGSHFWARLPDRFWFRESGPSGRSCHHCTHTHKIIYCKKCLHAFPSDRQSISLPLTLNWQMGKCSLVAHKMCCATVFCFIFRAHFWKMCPIDLVLSSVRPSVRLFFFISAPRGLKFSI